MVTITLKVLPDEAARFVKAAEACAAGQGLIDGAVHMAELALATPQAVDSDEHTTTVRTPVETVIHISAEGFEDAWVFVRPDGQRVSAAPCRPEVSPMSERPIANFIAGSRLAATTDHGVHPWIPSPGWDGVPLDYEACVESLST